MSSMKSKSTVAFFGATGDVAGYCLAAALTAGHQCVALARTPDKLMTSLKQKGVTTTALSNLRTIQGDARNLQQVSDALQVDGEVVDVVVSSLGSVPDLRWSITSPVMIKDPTLCGDGANVLLSALRSLNSTKKPLLLAVSTTGIQPVGKPRDVPLIYKPLYHWLLHHPHQDKAKLESTIRSASNEPNQTRPFSGYIIVKPTLLGDGASRGINVVRVGTEDEPALGFFIRRSEVGEWMFERLISRSPDKAFVNTAVSLTA